MFLHFRCDEIEPQFRLAKSSRASVYHNTPRCVNRRQGSCVRTASTTEKRNKLFQNYAVNVIDAASTSRMNQIANTESHETKHRTT